MKKYLMKGFAAIVFCGSIASCSHDFGDESGTVQNTVQETYEKAFVTRFGEPASTQTWGFGSGKAMTRSQYEPSVQHLNAPYDTEWITNYLSTAKEPNDQNISYNNNNTTNLDYTCYNSNCNKNYKTYNNLYCSCAFNNKQYSIKNVCQYNDI